MINTMPTFAVFKNENLVGYVNAVSYEQAKGRALGLHGRCEVLATGNARMDRKGRHADSYTHGRSPYPNPGFEDRRRELIEAYKAGE